MMDLARGRELLPCPFCGGEGRLSGLRPTYVAILCDACEGEGPPALTEGEANAAWNRRSAAEREAKLREALAMLIAAGRAGSAHMMDAALTAARRALAGEGE